MRKNPVRKSGHAVNSSEERKARGKRPYHAPTLKGGHPFVSARADALINRFGKKRFVRMDAGRMAA